MVETFVLLAYPSLTFSLGLRTRKGFGSPILESEWSLVPKKPSYLGPWTLRARWQAHFPPYQGPKHHSLQDDDNAAVQALGLHPFGGRLEAPVENLFWGCYRSIEGKVTMLPMFPSPEDVKLPGFEIFATACEELGTLYQMLSRPERDARFQIRPVSR